MNYNHQTGMVRINDRTMVVKEFRGQRVLTFGDIDKAHGRTDGTAHRNFKANRNRFIDGADYFRRNSSEAKSEFGITAPNGLILITESGYLMLAKSFTDDLAWTVQRELVNSYFRNKNAENSKVEQLTLETKEYHYYDKSFEGKPVLSPADFEHFTGISEHRVRYYLEKFCEKHVDYYLLEGPFLYKYKMQNPNVSKLASTIFVISKRGFIKAIEYFSCKNSIPNQLLEKFSSNENVHGSLCTTEDECIVALSVLQKVKSREEICKNKYKNIGQSSMASEYEKDIEAIKIAMKSVAMMLMAVK